MSINKEDLKNMQKQVSVMQNIEKDKHEDTLPEMNPLQIK